MWVRDVFISMCYLFCVSFEKESNATAHQFFKRTIHGSALIFFLIPPKPNKQGLQIKPEVLNCFLPQHKLQWITLPQIYQTSALKRWLCSCGLEWAWLEEAAAVVHERNRSKKWPWKWGRGPSEKKGVERGIHGAWQLGTEDEWKEGHVDDEQRWCYGGDGDAVCRDGERQRIQVSGEGGCCGDCKFSIADAWGIIQVMVRAVLRHLAVSFWSSWERWGWSEKSGSHYSVHC